MKPMRESMRRYEGKVDVCIVGAGAAGSTLAKELAEGGLSVVVLEAGPWLDTRKDFVNDELEMLDKFDWVDKRISEGTDPIEIGRFNTGKAIGGSTVHFTAVKLRLHREDFQLRSQEGLAEDWPLSLDELKPYYDKVEHFIGVSGPRDFPWGDYEGGFPQAEISMSAADEAIASGFEKLGLRWRSTPHAIITAPFGGRAPCMNYGFCVSGCKSDAKGGAHVTWVPAAVKAGAEFRENCFAYQVEASGGKARRVLYFHEGKSYAQEADLIILSCYAIETPRLLLNSGIANSNGLVGKCLMVHPGSEVLGHFPQPLDPFTTPPVGILTMDAYGSQPGRPFKRGYIVNRYHAFPIEFANLLISGNPGIWGEELMEIMDGYTHWTSLGSINEMLPRQTNFVALADEKDENGIPVARVSMSYDENDRAMLKDSARFSEEVLRAAGADKILHSSANYHLLGTCRMGVDAESSVVDRDCRSWELDNLFICDGSVFVTEGAVNPSLTIEAIAMRTAERILSGVAAENRSRYVA